MINVSNNHEIVIGSGAFMIITHILPFLFAAVTPVAANAASEVRQACDFLSLKTVLYDMLTHGKDVLLNSNINPVIALITRRVESWQGILALSFFLCES